MNKIKGLVLVTFSMIFFIAFAATISALIISFTVESTLSAVESAFGSLILSLCFLVLGLKAFKAGKACLIEQVASNVDEPNNYKKNKM